MVCRVGSRGAKRKWNRLALAKAMRSLCLESQWLTPWQGDCKREMAEDIWHPEAVGSVSAGDGEFVINLFKNGQVQKSLYSMDTSLSSACVPLPPPCTTSA